MKHNFFGLSLAQGMLHVISYLSPLVSCRLSTVSCVLKAGNGDSNIASEPTSL